MWYDWSVQDDKIYLGKLFCIDEDERTRKHSLSLKITSHVNSSIGMNFFTMRVINYWNHLADVVVSCKSLSAFKIKLDEFMTAKGEIYIYCKSINQLMHELFLLLVLFWNNLLGIWMGLSRYT